MSGERARAGLRWGWARVRGRETVVVVGGATTSARLGTSVSDRERRAAAAARRPELAQASLAARQGGSMVSRSDSRGLPRVCTSFCGLRQGEGGKCGRSLSFSPAARERTAALPQQFEPSRSSSRLAQAARPARVRNDYSDHAQRARPAGAKFEGQVVQGLPVGRRARAAARGDATTISPADRPTRRRPPTPTLDLPRTSTRPSSSLRPPQQG